MTAKIEPVVPRCLAWECPSCMAVCGAGTRECRCGTKAPGKMGDRVTPVGAAWVCPVCHAVNSHTRIRCACSSERPAYAVDGMELDGAEEWQARMPTVKAILPTKKLFLRQRLMPNLGRVFLHIIPQVAVPAPHHAKFELDYLCIAMDGTVRCYNVFENFDVKSPLALLCTKAQVRWPGLNLEVWSYQKQNVKVDNKRERVIRWTRVL